MTTYRDRLTEAMTLLAAHHPSALVLGQAISYPGTGMTDTFKGVPRQQLIELPVAEDMQLGMSIGFSLAGHHPVVSVYPRINFLILALNQLVLHLDALPRFSTYRPKLIIRTAVAHDSPLNPGPQHLGNYSYAIEDMLKTVKVVRLRRAYKIVQQYREALVANYSTILVEYTELYDYE